MQPRAPKYLEDIRNAAAFILSDLALEPPDSYRDRSVPPTGRREKLRAYWRDGALQDTGEPGASAGYPTYSLFLWHGTD